MAFGLVNVHKNQMEAQMAQNSKIEEFMSEVVKSMQNHQKKISDLGTTVFTVESNSK